MKRFCFFVSAALISSMLFMSSAQAAQTESDTVSAAEAVLEAEEAVVIGTKTETTSETKFKNETGKEIKALKIKDIYAGSYPDSLMTEGTTVKDGQEFVLYFDPAKDGAKSYNMLFEYADGTTGSITMFPFTKVTECVLKTEEKLTYITYVDDTGKECSTLDKEKVYRGTGKKAASSNSSSNRYEESYDNGWDDYDDYDYYENYAEEGDSSYDYSVKEETTVTHSDADDSYDMPMTDEEAAGITYEKPNEETLWDGEDDGSYDTGDDFYDDGDDGSGGCIDDSGDGSGGCIEGEACIGDTEELW